jgi:hypothetical protein
MEVSDELHAMTALYSLGKRILCKNDRDATQKEKVSGGN